MKVLQITVILLLFYSFSFTQNLGGFGGNFMNPDIDEMLGDMVDEVKKMKPSEYLQYSYDSLQTLQTNLTDGQKEEIFREQSEQNIVEVLKSMGFTIDNTDDIIEADLECLKSILDNKELVAKLDSEYKNAYDMISDYVKWMNGDIDSELFDEMLFNLANEFMMNFF